MGNCFTSTQIYNTKQLDREQFISFFCEEMKKNGYVPGNSDESEVSYILRFADDCKWVTITSEDYDEGNQLSQTDTGRIAKMLKTTCINTTVIDSDCAVMDMYNKSGQKDDTLIMGRADDYFGDEITQPSMKAWKPFLAEGRSWEQFCDIVQDSASYTFIEDGLSELATVIGMDESEILFHASVAEEDEQTVFLYFNKAAAKEKKLTLKAAFIKVFGEALEPLGFKLVKSKYPYYLRVVGEGIIQGVSVSKEKSFDCDPNEEGFSIYVGVSLLSLPLINFDKNPAIIDNQQWMISLNELYRRFLVYLDEFNEECKEYSLFYKKGKSEEMLDTLRKSRYEFMPFVLEYLEKLKTLEDIYQAGDILPGINDDAIILLDRIDEQIEKIKKHLPEKIKMLESVHANNPASFEVLKEHYIKNHEKRIKRWTSLKKGGEAYDDYMKTAEKTKEKNMRVMENLGVIPKKG